MNNNKFDFEDNFIEKGCDAEEEKLSEFDVRKCKFSTYGGDFSIRQIMFMIQEKEIKTPSIQRNYVWGNKEASRFIESILLDLPIPSIFLAKDVDARFIIVDGLQRLTTLYKYTIDQMKDGKTFRLSTSKDIHEEWRGKAFRELSLEDQRRINNKLLHAIIVEQKEPNNFDGLFLIFERINTGGIQLNQQEIRNAIFQYPILDLIHELNFNTCWRSMFGSTDPHSRMRDEEMILRFFALQSISILSYKKESFNMVDLLNDFLKNNRNTDIDTLTCLKNDFIETLKILYKLFGENVFRINLQTLKPTKKFFATLYDALMLSTDYARKKGMIFDLNSDYSSRLTKLMSDEEFLSSCNAHTTEKKAVITRITKACNYIYELNYED